MLSLHCMTHVVGLLDHVPLVLPVVPVNPVCELLPSVVFAPGVVD